MRRAAYVFAGLLVMLALLWTVPASAAAADDDAPRITKEELKTRLGEPALAVIDVRYSPNWKKSGQKIAKAVREDPTEIGSWVGKYRKDQALVLYCD
ncbi:MAG: hypothetical protein HY770_05870 [Chitinivibrionia bacterium]|nr:hypothetical protein [Chitinivibrionia bacterium]